MANVTPTSNILLRLCNVFMLSHLEYSYSRISTQPIQRHTVNEKMVEVHGKVRERASVYAGEAKRHLLHLFPLF